MGECDIEHGTDSPNSQYRPFLQREALAPCVLMMVKDLNWERA